MLEDNHIAGIQPDIIAVLVGVFRGHLALFLFYYQSQDGFVPCPVCSRESESVQWAAWLLFGSSGCSVAPGCGRIEGLSISAVHSDSLGAVVMGVRFVVHW